MPKPNIPTTLPSLPLAGVPDGTKAHITAGEDYVSATVFSDGIALDVLRAHTVEEVHDMLAREYPQTTWRNPSEGPR